ncbi:1-deoxy-D-xylulose-5-phosphate synthase, partial [Vibrio cholerae]|nr:1-deoxy-D-xylulose-5-phosphate synthase [Vibrio cholerae]
CIPNMLIMAPADENECRQMLYTGHQHQGPSAVRYPRGNGMGVELESSFTALEIGKGRLMRESTACEGEKVAILSFGTLLPNALQAAEKLNATVADMRFVKPLDEALIKQLAQTHDVLVTLEENAIAGGAGAGVIEFMMKEKQLKPALNLGLPDQFIVQGTQEEMHAELGLDGAGIERAIRDYLAK